MPLSQYERSALVPLSHPHSPSKMSLCIPHFTLSPPALVQAFTWQLQFLTNRLPSNLPHFSPLSSQLPEPSCDGIFLTKDLSGSPQWTSMAQLDFPEQLETPQVSTRIPEGSAQEASPLYSRKQTQARVVMLDRTTWTFRRAFSSLPLATFCPLPPWIPWALFYLWSVDVGLASPLSSPLLPVSMWLLL